jgi:hypothetical protein
MKLFKHSLLGASAFALLLTLNACGDIFGLGESFLKAEFDGELKEWNGAMVTALKVDTFDGVLIQAIKTENVSNIETIVMALDEFDGEGTYNIDLISSTLVTYSLAGTSSTNTALSTGGVITVNSYKNSVIEGEFSFSLKTMDENTIEVKNGSFQAKLIE